MIVLLFEIRAFYLGTLESEHDFMWNELAAQKNENLGFPEKHEID